MPSRTGSEASSRPLIADVLPPQVVAVESFVDTGEDVLYPEERAVIARAVDRRRREFATVRACARTALARLGVPPAPILPGTRGAPGWPAGVVGSMTHCDGYRAAAVARAAHVRSLGVDAEPDEPLPDGVLDLVSLDEERARLAGLAARHPAVCWDRLLFCAKESVYKAWYPLAGRWLGFDEVAVTVDADAGTFAARLLVGGPLPAFAGRWLVRDGIILTAVTVPAP
ncbi:4'-phosphopantetheinyl transferase family protein [Planosporangium mesophilum]|uniref:4'-phosphopantetheinyl transferase family protein n=1 Tax=Planosporangium mesophilum TaxID=689768 RepID=UPI0027E59465|nr:4'-phosphopantetheinyl transferase superfamily protein [Planosporangium mesophilum]